MPKLRMAAQCLCWKESRATKFKAPRGTLLEFKVPPACWDDVV